MADEIGAPAAAPAQDATAAAAEAEALRTRLKEATARLERVRRERDDFRSELEHLRTGLHALGPAGGAAPSPGAASAPGGKVLVDREAHEQLRQAKRDLVRLLRRLGRPPLGWVLRRQKGYRRLRQRWLREG